MKILLKIFIAIAILTTLILILLINNIGGLIKSTINDRGESLFGVPMAVADVDVNLISGQVTLTDFSVKNPVGFRLLTHSVWQVCLSMWHRSVFLIPSS